jgi:FKBP-type peptidyl-prolyl cis-trans isomerase FkpA
MLSRPWIAAAALLIAACGAPPKPPEVKLDTEDSQVIYALGIMLAQRIEGFALTPDELVIFESGVRDGVNGQPPKVDPSTMQDKVQAFATARQSAMATKEKAESAAYLTKMAAEPGATTAQSGYVVRTLTEGTGASPGPNDTVKVHYHGTLRDGTVFDSSVDRGTPAEFPLGRVIPCWTQSLQTMKVGGKYKLTCPSDIAYGDRGSLPTIKPGAALSFEVELIEIKPGEAAPPVNPHG